MSTLRIDLHTHLKVSKRTPLQENDPLRFAATIRRRGLDGLAITEHFHAPGFWDVYDALEAEHPRRDGRYEIDGILFFVGAELTLRERVDVLILAPMPELRRLDTLFPRRLSAGFHPGAEELLDACRLHDVRAIRIAAHPFRADKPVDALAASVIDELFHAVEINARYLGEQDALIERFADDHGLAVVGGSDAHTWPGLGAVWTDAAMDGDTFDDLLDAIQRRRTSACVHERASELCEAGRDLKGVLKARLPKLPRLPELDEDDDVALEAIGRPRARIAAAR